MSTRTRAKEWTHDSSVLSVKMENLTILEERVTDTKKRIVTVTCGNQLFK